MSRRTPEQIGRALDELNYVYRAGGMSEGVYEVHKAQLFAEATRRPLPLSARFLLVFGVVVAVLMIIGTLISIT